MKCDVCRERPAIIFVQQVTRGSSIELHLCEDCARERGFTPSEKKVDISIGGLFSGILDGSIAGSLDENLDGSVKGAVCPVCGFSLSTIKKHLKTGCAVCYQHFKGDIVSLLRREGIEISYTGNISSKAETQEIIPGDSDNLKQKLQTAIENEDFESAAYYRDRIRSLNGGNK